MSLQTPRQTGSSPQHLPIPAVSSQFSSSSLRLYFLASSLVSGLRPPPSLHANSFVSLQRRLLPPARGSPDPAAPSPVPKERATRRASGCNIPSDPRARFSLSPAQIRRQSQC